MYKNSKVAKNCSSSAVPAQRNQAAPFVPAAAIPAAGSDMHGRTAATRKAKNAKLAKAAKASADTLVVNHKEKNRTSGFDEKYIEWELPVDDHNTLQHDKQYAPTGFYETDMNAFDWKLEQKRNYVRKEGSNNQDERTAGVGRPERTVAPASFAWELEKKREGAHSISYC